MKRKDDETYIQSLGRALEILHLFLDGTPLTLSAVAERAGISTSAAYRVLHTLTEHGLLAPAGSRKLYFLNDETILLGLAGIRGRKITRAAQPLIHEYYVQSGHTVGVTAPVGLSAVSVLRYCATLEETDLLQPFETMPLHLGASQRVLLASLPEERRQAYLDTLYLDASARKSLLDQLTKIREQGWDYTEGHLTRGIWALSVPVFYTTGRIAGSLYSTGFIGETNPQLRSERLRQLQRLAGETQRRISLMD